MELETRLKGEITMNTGQRPEIQNLQIPGETGGSPKTVINYE